jgi:hypothetical protein
MNEHKLGPVKSFVVLRVEGSTVVFAKPLEGEQRLPISDIRMVEMRTPSKWTISRARTIVVHGPGGPVWTLQGVGKHGEAAYQWLLSLQATQSD